MSFRLSIEAGSAVELLKKSMELSNALINIDDISLDDDDSEIAQVGAKKPSPRQELSPVTAEEADGESDDEEIETSGEQDDSDSDAPEQGKAASNGNGLVHHTPKRRGRKPGQKNKPKEPTVEVAPSMPHAAAQPIPVATANPVAVPPAPAPAPQPQAAAPAPTPAQVGQLQPSAQAPAAGLSVPNSEAFEMMKLVNSKLGAPAAKVLVSRFKVNRFSAIPPDQHGLLIIEARKMLNEENTALM